MLFIRNLYSFQYDRSEREFCSYGRENRLTFCHFENENDLVYGLINMLKQNMFNPMHNTGLLPVSEANEVSINCLILVTFI